MTVAVAMAVAISKVKTMNYLLPNNLPKYLEQLLIPCQWGEFIQISGANQNRFKVKPSDFSKIRPLCKLIKRQPLRVEPTTYSIKVSLDL